MYLYYIKCNTPALHICIVMYQTTIGYKHKYFFILDSYNTYMYYLIIVRGKGLCKQTVDLTIYIQ